MKSLESTNLISKYHIVFKMEYHSIIHWTPLHIATDRNYYEIAQLLIKQKRIDINLKDKIFFTHSTFSQIYKWNHLHSIYWTPLHLAAEKGHLKIAELLINHPNINVNRRADFVLFRNLWFFH